MTDEFTGNTFSGTYRDDFADSDGYHKVLFNSGRYLQGRELNQLQTILQTQITRMASNLFLDGAAISPKSSGSVCSVTDYIIVDNFDPNSTSVISASDYIGTMLKGRVNDASSVEGILFKVTHADETNENVLYGRYVSEGQTESAPDNQTDPIRFTPGDVLDNESGSTNAEGGEILPSLTVRADVLNEPASIGRGVLFSMQSAEFYCQGHFVFAPSQTIILSKFDPIVDALVGFKVIQDIVTESDDQTLYDNQGSRPNLSSPGAHRYRIRMVLTKDTDVLPDEEFVSFVTVRASSIVQIKDGTDNYNQVEKRMAVRSRQLHRK
jgi:hypothetical protein